MRRDAKFTPDVKLKETTKELGYRRRVYDRLVDRGKMSRADADRRMLIMEDIRDDYASLAAEAKPTLF
jgi:hypothetical protein